MTRRNLRRSFSAKAQALRPALESLETRSLLSLTASPSFDLGPLVSNTTPPSGAFTPAQIRQAYGFNNIQFGTVQGNGTGQTIAIVDAQDDPNIQKDLNTFDAQFGLPNVTITKVNQTGGTSYPATDSTGGWELEEALDVEWAHAIATGAKILLVEASSSSDNDLLAAVDYAAAHANVVSMSWGGGEFSGENAGWVEANFIKSGVVFVASSGDSGAPASWPAASPNVLGVGGTSLTLGAGSSWGSESGWSGSGGGPSAYEAQPSYQSGVVTQTTKRATPDVAYDANPSTGFAVYDSDPYNGVSYGWIDVGGTSAGAPQWSALMAIADQGRALSGQPAINATSPQEAAKILYQNAGTADFHDVTTGTSTGQTHYSAGVGYDYVTGIGSPVANLVVRSLDGGTTTPPSTPDSLMLSSATSVTAGNVLNVTVTAQNASGSTDTGFLDTVQFSSSDQQAGLPSSYTFNSTDQGSHTFAITLKTAGSQSVTVTDTSTSVSAKLSGIAVSPAATSTFVLSGLSTSQTAGVAASFTVTARDPYGNVATGYAGTVQFSSSDGQATLPGAYTFGSGNQGVHSFNVTFGTGGSQSLTVSDSVGGFSATQSGISVAPPAPQGLTAQATSSSQITLSWNAVSGATSYQVQRSANGSTGWSQISTTTGSVLTYQDTGLSAGTTYYYRVSATAGGLTSGFSSTASAMTSGTSSGGGTGGGTGSTTTDTLWSTSYKPIENGYSYGSYELGVKFTSSVAGTVTGVRFYKAWYMGGLTHVGHLWSSTGTLLATATFTGETSSGWQQVNFAKAVTISPNTVYIVSFSSGGGDFGITTGYFSRSGYTNGPLQALSNSTSGGDGVYQYKMGAFPTVSSGGMNFWVDVAFSPTSSLSSLPTSGRSVATSSPVTLRSSTKASATSAGTGSTSTPAKSTLPTVSVSSRFAVPQGVTSSAFSRNSGSILGS